MTSKLPSWLNAVRTPPGSQTIFSTIKRNSPRKAVSTSAPHLLTVLECLEAREDVRHGYRESPPTKSAANNSRNPTTTSPVHYSQINPSEHYSVSVGHMSPYNRYYNIVPYDRTRIILNKDTNGEDRYLNASWVQELCGKKWWIATQAPRCSPAILVTNNQYKPPAENDSGHAFLSVVYHETTVPFSSQKTRLRTIVQLTQTHRSQADAYFPSQAGPGHSQVFQPEEGSELHALKVTLLSDPITVEGIHCTESKISIEELDGASHEPVTFCHLTYTDWPDHGIPRDVSSILKFIRYVDQCNKKASRDFDPDPPIMVHCSAGVGRTGCFIALSSLLRHYNLLVPGEPTSPPMPTPVCPTPLGPLFENTELESPLSVSLEALRGDLVAQEIDSLREQRPGMVQQRHGMPNGGTQIEMIYEVLISAFNGS